MPHLKISVALWSLGVPETMAAFEKNLDQAASVGVKAVQPWIVDEPAWKMICSLDPDRCTTAEQRSAARKACEQRGLEISGFCSQLKGPKTLGGFGEPEGLEGRIKKTKKALQLAVDIGSPIVTTHIGPIPSDTTSETYERLKRSIGEIATAAEKCGALFALETGEEKAEVMKSFIEDIGSPNLKVNYDPANMLRQNQSAEGVPILADYIVHTHAKDKHPETGKPTVGQGAVPWAAYLAALQKIGYQGWYAIEDESNSPNVLESIRTGVAFLEKNG